MNAKWLIAKYMGDIRRREPRNVGVLLFTDAGVHSRFKGEESGVINGHKVKGVFGSLDNYKAWVAYWKRAAANGDPVALVNTDKTENYFLEVGGERLLGNAGLNPEDFVNGLYRELVEEDSATELGSPLSERKELVERTFDRLKISSKIIKAPRLPIERDGIRDVLAFDYSYRNGIYALMRQVVVAKDAAWEGVHAAVYNFQQAQRENASWKLISLVSFSPSATAESKEPVKLLGQHAEVIDLSDEKRADIELGTALNLRQLTA